MNTIDDLVTLLRDELGLPVTAADTALSFDQLPGWDSVHLLWLGTALEKATGRPLSIADLLEASSLDGVYALAVGA